MSFKAQLLELEKQKAHVLALEAKAYADRQVSLAGLSRQFGYLDLTSFIKALRSASKFSQRRKPRVKKQPRQQPTEPHAIGEGMAKSLPPKPTEPTQPTGTSLDDPANFGLRPDSSLLDLDLVQDPQAKIRLSEALSYAVKVLHTSKIPAAVWREWRQFERQAVEKLRVKQLFDSNLV